MSNGWAGYGKSGGGEATPRGRYDGYDDGTMVWPETWSQMQQRRARESAPGAKRQKIVGHGEIEREQDSIDLLELALERILGEGGKRPTRRVQGLDVGELGDTDPPKTLGDNLEWIENELVYDDAMEVGRRHPSFKKAPRMPREIARQGVGYGDPPPGHRIPDWVDEGIGGRHNPKGEAERLLVQALMRMMAPQGDPEARFKAALEPIAGE